MAVVIGSSIIPFTPDPPAVVTLPGGGTVVTQSSFPAALTLPGGAVVTQEPYSGYVLGSQTLVPGGSAITVDGTLVSLAPGGTEVVVGSVTEIWTASVGMGGVIMSGFAGGGGGGGAEKTSTATTAGFNGVTPFAGNAPKRMGLVRESEFGVMLGVRLLVGLYIYV